MDALFYPTLSLPGAAWTNPNLLFFDQIGVISPPGALQNLFDGPTRRLIQYGLVTPVEAQNLTRDDDGDGYLVAHIMGAASAGRRSQDMARMHVAKFGRTRVQREMVERGLLWPSYSGEWLEGPAWIINTIMSAMAVRIATHPDIRVPLLTNARDSERLVVGEPSVPTGVLARRLRAVSRLLPIGPDAELAEIMRFRDDHANERRNFRILVENLINRSATDPDGDDDFMARLRQAEEHRRHLVGELQAVRSNVPALTLGLSISAIAAASLENSFYSAAVCLGTLFSLLHDHGVQSRRARAARQSPLVYAALVGQTFRPSRAQDILR